MTIVFALLGLCVGVILGIMFPGFVPSQFTTYLAVGLVAAIDTVLGGLNAYTKKEFSFKIFASGFFFNSLAAVLLTYIGKLLSIDLYLAAVVVFGMRIFQNIAELRRILLKFSTKSVNLNIMKS